MVGETDISIGKTKKNTRPNLDRVFLFAPENQYFLNLFPENSLLLPSVLGLALLTVISL